MWMLGRTPPEAIVTPLSSLLSSSSFLTASWMCLLKDYDTVREGEGIITTCYRNIVMVLSHSNTCDSHESAVATSAATATSTPAPSITAALDGTGEANLGMMRVFLLSRAAFPASSRISAARYSSTAARYTGAPAPIRLAYCRAVTDVSRQNNSTAV